MFRFLIRLAPSTPKSCIFDSNTKASVKVYHLQEYAKYRSGLLEHDSSPDARSACGPYRAESVRDIALYRRIEDWRFLVKDVNACIRDLSPTQLVATAIAYWRLGRVGRSEWKALCSAAARYAYNPNANISGISSSEVALILCCYARVFTQQVPSSLSLLRWIVRDVGRLNERDICMILFYMRRMGCLSPKLESSTHQMYAGMLRAIVMGLAVEGGNKLSKFSPRGLVCVVYNLACIGHIPWSVVYRACNVIRKNVGQLDLKAMALHARSLAMLKFPDTRTLELFAVAIERMKMVDTASITCLLHSYAKLGYRQRGNFTSLLERIHKGIFLFKDHEVAQVSFAMGQLGYRCNEVFESIFLFLENRILHQSPQNLSMFMQSFAKVGLYRREIVELLMGHAKDMKSGFTFSQVLTLLDACVVIGHYDKDAYEWLLSAITQHSEDELSQGVLNKLNCIMYCIRLERPEFVEVATPATRTLIDMYQGNFQMEPPPEPREPLYECLQELGVDYERSSAIGPYRVDALLSNGLALDMLSEASLCPITREQLGSVQLKSRHLKLLGYQPAHISLREWLRKGRTARDSLLRETLAL